MYSAAVATETVPVLRLGSVTDSSGRMVPSLTMGRSSSRILMVRRRTDYFEHLRAQ